MTPASPARPISSSSTSSAAETGIVIGVGHSERQDDGVGPYVALALCRRGVPAVVHEGDGTGLLELWDGLPACLVVDAVADDAAPGLVRVFADFEDPAFARAMFVHSTHRLGLPEAVALGRALGRMPGRLVVVGIAGAAFGFGSSLSAEVMAAAERLIERLAAAEDAFDPDVLADMASN